MKHAACETRNGYRVRRFFKTPKGLLTIALGLLVALAMLHERAAQVLPGLAGAVLTAGLLDVVILRLRRPRWEFPGGAVLTGLIVAMVMSPYEPWWVPTATSVIAIASKYILRIKTTNVFNPAALALVVSFYAFNTEQSWWGALPELPMWAITALLLTGVFIADRVNKMPLVLAFLGAYYLLFTAAAFAGEPRHVVEIFRAPDLHAALYFAFFMLTDPPTAPIKYRDQLVCGSLVAVISWGLFETAGVVYFLLAGLLVGNVWEAWRRLRFRQSRRVLFPG